MIRFRPDIPFARDDAQRLVPWIVGFMVCLTGLMLGASLSVTRTVEASRTDYVDRIQIEVPYIEDGMEAAVERAAEKLKATKGISEVRRLPVEEMQKLIEPWLGKLILLDALPLPAILEAKLIRGEDDLPIADIAALRVSLNQVLAGITVDTHDQWVREFSRYVSTVQAIALALAVLLLTCAISVVVLTARTGLKLHFKTVAILHQIGARDDYIQRQFEMNGTLLVLKGALAGTAAALLTFTALVFMGRGLNSPILPAVEITPSHLLMFFLLPVFTAFIGFLATRVTIRTMLHNMH